MAADLIAGIFVGGRGSRMGGIPKGLLLAPDGEPIVLRTRRLLEAAGASVLLVGTHPGYAGLGLERLSDDASATGPLAGLLALLRRAGGGAAIAVACDMPRLSPGLVRRLVEEAPDAPVVAPRRQVPGRGWVWDPLFARYDPRRVEPVARGLAAEGKTRLQLVLDAAGAEALDLADGQLADLIDWDSPEDLHR